MPAEAAASQVELQLGIQSFNSKHYSDAVGHLQQYVAAEPHESIGHYYLANCLFSLGYEKPCLTEYALALKDSTSQKMTDYCRDAIRSIQTSKQVTIAKQSVANQTVANQTVANQIVDNQIATSQTVARQTLARQTQKTARQNVFGRTRPDLYLNPPLAELRMSSNSSAPLAFFPLPTEAEGVQDLALEKTLVRMTDQSNVEIATLLRNHEADLESLKQHLTDDIFRLNRDRDIRIQALLDGSKMKGSSSSDSVDSIRKDTATKIAASEAKYESTTEARQNQYLERVAELQNALRVSQDQVADARRVPGNHPNLQLAGTDLYTRNYTPSPNLPPPDELVATPERLVIDAHSRPGRTISKVVRDPAEQSLTVPGADLKVHGQLVK